MSTQKELLNQIAAKQKQHAKEMHDLQYQAYLAWKKEDGYEDQKLHRQMTKNAALAEKYNTTNGATIEAFKKAGIKVHILHLRYEGWMTNIDQNVDLENTADANRTLKFNPQFLVPSYMRKTCSFDPKGGVTHVILRLPNNEVIRLTSLCSIKDTFDYKFGIKKALEQLTPETVQSLLNEGYHYLSLKADTVNEEVDEHSVSIDDELACIS
jgi:hypothetical protein